MQIYKNKVDVKECGNYKGIKLIIYTVKVWEKVIQKRSKEEITLSGYRFGFMSRKKLGQWLLYIYLENSYIKVPKEVL